MSKTSDRKKREYLQREKQLLRIVDQMSLDPAQQNWTMDQFILSTDYSKGTIYKHFSCKEDVLGTLYYEKFYDLYRLFKAIIESNLCTLHKELGLHIAHSLFDDLYFPNSSRLMAPNDPSFRNKMSEARQKNLTQLQTKFEQLLVGLILEAIDLGDLKVLDQNNIPSIALANQALSFGILALKVGRCSSPQDSLLDLHLESACKLLKGYGWKARGDQLSNTQLVLQIRNIFIQEIMNNTNQKELI